MPPYTLRRSARTKRLKLKIFCNGDVVVTAPTFLEQDLIECFISSRTLWVQKKVSYFKSLGLTFLPKNTKADYKRHKEAATALVNERVAYFNTHYDFLVNTISIKNQKTRWGSCSEKRNLNFNYKIVQLPAKLSDYIIVHELCHLRELNHSRAFWCLVEQTIPDYRERRIELKKIGML